MKARTKNWLILYLFVILSFLSFILSFPTVPVSFNFAGREVNKTFSGPDINFKIFGKEFYKEVNLKLGLDLGGGTRFVLLGDMENIPEEKRDLSLEDARNIMEERIQLFNLTEPQIYTSKVENEYRIVLELADEENAVSAVAIAGQHAKLEVREIKEEFKESADPNVMYDPNSFADAAVSSKDIIGSNIKKNPNTGSPIIKLQLTDEGKNKFSELAARNAGGFVAIFLDGSIISFQGISPEVQSDSAGEPVISGNFTSEQVRLLDSLISSGSLPFPVSIVEKVPFEARVDTAAVRSGLTAICTGILITAIFLIFRYKILGLLAGLSLGAHLLFLSAIFKLGAPSILLWIFTGEFGTEILTAVRLTFAGILGSLLSGLFAVTVSILIFEKLKDKIKKVDFGETVHKCFSESRKTIQCGGILVFIICVILGRFGTGQLRSFAITFSLGLLTVHFMIFILLKTLVLLFYKRKN